MKSIVHHGILQLANNSFITNCEIEALEDDPTPLRIGRIWFNSFDKVFKYSGLDFDNNVIICEFGSNSELTNFIANLQSANGSELIGYSGNFNNSQFSVPEGTLKSTLDLIIDKVATLQTAVTSVSMVVDEFIVVIQNNNFVLSRNITDENNIIVSVNGMIQSSTIFTINNQNILHFDSPLSEQDVLKVIIFNS